MWDNWVMSWIKNVWKWAAGLVRSVSPVLDYLPEILQVVEWVHNRAQARTDRELMEVGQELGVTPNLSAANRGEELARMVAAWAMHKWPGAPYRHIRRVIEIAYGIVRP